MQRANELRNRKVCDLQENMQKLTNRVDEKLGLRNEQREADYFEKFKNNLEKRKKVEDKKKKLGEEKAREFEYN